MIDNKKIEDVAKVYMIGEFYDKDEAEWNYPITNEEKRNQCIIDFKAGTKWAINEFIKDLWHPANEVPEIGRVIIMENYYPDGRIMFISHMRKSTFHNPIDIGNTKKWFYIEDLFPKEGDKQ